MHQNAHFHDSPTMTSAQRSRDIVAVTWLGMVVNLVLVVIKLTAGIVARSQVLVADAVHSVSDLISDLAILVGVRFWSQPADDSHPHGHAKIENMVTLFIGVLLLIVGVELIFSATATIRELIAGKEYPNPGALALIASFISIAVKEALYWITLRVGRKTDSSALVANAWHHRSDAISSIPAAIAVGGCLILGPHYQFLDPVGTIIVSCMIIYTALMIVRPAISPLLDSGCSHEMIENIGQTILTNEQVRSVHKIRTRSMGNQNIAVDLHVEVDPAMTVRDAHCLSHQLQQKLKESFPTIVDVIVHVEPWKIKMKTDSENNES